MLNLEHYEEAIAKLEAGGFACIEGEINLNLACWLGERAKYLVREVKVLRAHVEELKRQRAVLVAACERAALACSQPGGLCQVLNDAVMQAKD